MPNTMEEMASKAAGKAGAARAKMKGLHGIFVRLAEEHKQAAALLKRALASDDAAKRADIWSQLRRELLSHERAELRAVYPSLETTPESISEQHAEDAQTLESLIAEVDAQPHDSESWKKSLEELKSVIEEHVELEEEYFFPKMQDAVGKDLAKQIESRYLREKEVEMKALR
jgi:hemerythrin superfamily protein